MAAGVKTTQATGHPGAMVSAGLSSDKPPGYGKGIIRGTDDEVLQELFRVRTGSSCEPARFLGEYEHLAVMDDAGFGTPTYEVSG